MRVFTCHLSTERTKNDLDQLSFLGLGMRCRRGHPPQIIITSKEFKPSNLCTEATRKISPKNYHSFHIISIYMWDFFFCSALTPKNGFFEMEDSGPCCSWRPCVPFICFVVAPGAFLVVRFEKPPWLSPYAAGVVSIGINQPTSVFLAVQVFPIFAILCLKYPPKKKHTFPSVPLHFVP